MSVIKTALKFFKPMLKCESKLLGRWNLKNCSVKEGISALYANTDHCGDSLCGNPKEVSSVKGEILAETKIQKQSSIKGNK